MANTQHGSQLSSTSRNAAPNATSRASRAPSRMVYNMSSATKSSRSYLWRQQWTTPTK
eukprot:CAMPEP_0195115034 /NCGR_PEP_ID=MMETSP0448-20130528/107802_1 /TAXON_ID=66468 /ORGANISM="Heterocapsa triquestra, Strain CCMP 448" /LENGTH=57 /DNA_ID=CAMNT_0040152111 /DNA_START=36 /DNA_END=206 /DNA_ORIENTATION=+